MSLLVGALLLSLAAIVQAALPPAGTSFSFHDHANAGKNWHLEFRIDPSNPKLIKTLVAYSEVCKTTIAKTGVPISDAGVIAATGPIKNSGTWEVNATFTAPTTAVGTMRMKSTKCDTGVLSYPNAMTGDGHTGHTHGGGHNHGSLFPDFDGASLKQRRQAQRLHGAVLRKWRGMTLAKAKRLGFDRRPGAKPLVGHMFHVYSPRYEADKLMFDARRPESLVFWRLSNGQSVILGTMFRVPIGKRPSFGGPIPMYHGHADSAGKIPNKMTHVWMVKGSRTAWYNCLPVRELEQYNPAFKWAPDTKREHVGGPCPDRPA